MNFKIVKVLFKDSKKKRKLFNATSNIIAKKLIIFKKKILRGVRVWAEKFTAKWS